MQDKDLIKEVRLWIDRLTARISVKSSRNFSHVLFLQCEADVGLDEENKQDVKDEMFLPK